MAEEKRNRIIAACTINAVLLIFILIATIIAQVITMCVLAPRRDALSEEYKALIAEYEEDEYTLEKLKNDKEFREMMIKIYQMGMLPEN